MDHAQKIKTVQAMALAYSPTARVETFASEHSDLTLVLIQCPIWGEATMLADALNRSTQQGCMRDYTTVVVIVS